MSENLDKIEINKHLLKELKNPPIWTEEEKKIIAWTICWEGCRLSYRKGRTLQHSYTPFEIEYQRKVHALNQKRGKRK